MILELYCKIIRIILWKLSHRNRKPLVRTATHQFNAENKVFETVRVKIWKKLVLWTRCFLRAREKCVSSVCKLQKIATKCEKMQKSWENAKNREKMRKSAKKMRKVAKKASKKRHLMGWSASYGVASYWRMCGKINRLGAQSDILGGTKIGVKYWGLKLRCSKTVSFFVYFTFTIFSRIIPFLIFTKKMAWVSPIFPRADRPE